MCMYIYSRLILLYRCALNHALDDLRSKSELMLQRYEILDLIWLEKHDA